MKLPLANHNHNFWDKLKLAYFLLTKRWSMGEKVAELEKKLAEKSGYKYCVATSSGSTANTLLAMWIAKNTTKRKIVVSANTWSTTITPFINLGFEPVFVDVDKDSPLMDCHQLDKTLKEHDGEIAAVFYTTLLGIRRGAAVDDYLNKIKNFCELNKVELYVDSCEDTMGMFRDGQLKKSNGEAEIIKAETTSFYLAHEFQACPEMGAIFTNDVNQYEFYFMARNHGMTRNLENNSRFRNDLVDSKFEFAVVGNNFRPTELSAYAVSLDLKRDQEFRIGIARDFYYSGSKKIYHYGTDIYHRGSDYMFALPIVVRQEYGEKYAKYCIDKIKSFAEELGIETRPIVGGNLLRQTIFQRYGDYRDYPNAEWFHEYGIYVGLYRNMNKKLLFKFRDRIANL